MFNNKKFEITTIVRTVMSKVCNNTGSQKNPGMGPPKKKRIGKPALMENI